MITDTTAFVTRMGCPENGMVKGLSRTGGHSTRIAAIRADLDSQRAAHVRQLLLPAELESIANLLAPHFDQAHGIDAIKRDSDGLITELENACQRDVSLAQSQVFIKCQQLATEFFGEPCHYGYDHAILKQPGSVAVDWHQDQHYSRMDLDKQCLTFWIPLQPTSQQNGGMEYAAGDYDLLPHTPVAKGSSYYRVSQEHLPADETFSPTMQPGDVCIHTPMTLHRSHPHQGSEARLAWILQFNRYGYSRFFRWGNIQRHIKKLYMLEPYQPADMARVKID
jgi:hypothetical protein